MSKGLSGWRECKLGDISVKIGSGATPTGGSNAYKPSGISLIRSQNILDFKFSNSGLAFIDEVQAYELRNVSVEENDVLLNITGDSVARCCIVPKTVLPARVNQHVAIIRLNDRAASYSFIYYLLQAKKEDLLMQSEIGATRKALTKGMIEELEILIPALPEQKAIAAVLSSLDDKIDLLHRQNKTLESMAETLFRQWFIEEDARDDWKEVPLGSLFSIASGKGIKKERLTDEGLFPVLGANGEIGRTNDYLFDEKLLYTGRVGTLGNIFIVNGERVWLSDNTLVFRKMTWFYFIYFSLKCSRIADYNAGSTQPLLRQSDVVNIPVVLPCGIKLAQFEKYAGGFFQKIDANQTQIRTLEKLRDTLLPKLMSGKVTVIN
ncbi:MAG: restriction endonuclease subunit S [Chlorobium sp.]